MEDPESGYPNLTSFLRIGLLILALGSVLGLIAMFYAMNVVDSSTSRATQQAEAAVMLGQAQSELETASATLNSNSEAFLNSPEVQAQAPPERAALRAELNRQDTDPRGPVLPPLLISLPRNDALDFQRTVDAVLKKAEPLLVEMTPGAKAADTRELMARTSAAMDTYYRAPNVVDFRLLRANLAQVHAQVDQAVPQLLASVRENEADARNASTIARWGLVAATVLMLLFVSSVVWLLSRRVKANIGRYESERMELNGMTERLRYRNTQLNALYNVFSEITDTLSLPYVISATTREALRVMNADMTVLRLLHGEDLVVVGNRMSDGSEIEGLPPVKLGETPTGRAAKRGRTVRIREDAQHQLGPVGAATGAVPNGGMQSGIIVPLIVGARVVGTLACWSFTAEAFNDEDERILEMMASQVATAVAVADTTEASERRAHQDALTGLPNRLQLSEDLQGDLAGLHAAGRRAVVAMADIDHFKHVNDENGHHLGDIVLQAVAHVLRGAVRPHDRVYRYGGEEFVIVFMDTEPQAAFDLANHLREAVGATVLGSDSESISPVTISIGLAALPDHGTDIEGLMSVADDAMYQAKDAGRNRVVLYGSSNQVLSRVA